MPKPSQKIAFTEENAALVPPPGGKTGALLWDAKQPGLALRIGRERRSWVVVYRPEGAGRSRAPQKITLGAFPAVSVAAARKAARAKLGDVASGRDPAAERREAKRKEKASLSLALDDYEASLKARGVVREKEVMALLRRGLSRYGNRDLAELELRDLLAPIEALEAAGKPGAADYLRRCARTFLGWAQMTGRIKANPLAGIRRVRATRAQRIDKGAYGRALGDDELRRVWGAADQETVFGRYIRALILTGARRGEMAQLTRAMIRDDRLMLPPAHTKQGREHPIPITKPLRAVLKKCPVTSSPLVFPSARTGGQLGGWTKLTQALRDASGVDFRLHDLRRTMRSGLTRLGIPTELAEVCIGHQRDELLEIYDRADRWNERADAFKRWAAHVVKVTRPSGKGGAHG